VTEKHLVSHIWHELVKVLHRLVYVHHLSPFTLLGVSASYGAVSCTERYELGALGRRICWYTD